MNRYMAAAYTFAMLGNDLTTGTPRIRKELGSGPKMIVDRKVSNGKRKQQKLKARLGNGRIAV